jgi:hypothetical protein
LSIRIIKMALNQSKVPSMNNATNIKTIISQAIKNLREQDLPVTEDNLVREINEINETIPSRNDSGVSEPECWTAGLY